MAVSSRVINPLLTKLARDRTGRISAHGLFCTDLAALGPYCQDLGPIFSQYGPRAWLIRCIYCIEHSRTFDNMLKIALGAWVRFQVIMISALSGVHVN